MLRKIQIFFVDGLLTVIGLTTIAGGLWYVFKSDAAMAATCMGTGLVLLFAATIDRFESLKGLGMEAKTRELTRTISKAETAVEQLKNVTEVAGGALISLASKTGRSHSAPSIREAYDLSRSVKLMLEEAGSTPEVIRQKLLPWANAEALDFARHQIRFIKEALKKHQHAIWFTPLPHNNNPYHPENAPIVAENKNRTSALIKFQVERCNWINGWRLDEYPVKLKAIIDDAPELTQDERATLHKGLEPALEQLEHLAANLEFKNPEVWIKFGRWREGTD